MATRRGGHLSSPANELKAREALQRVEEAALSVKQLKARLSFKGVENAGISNRVELARMALEAGLI